MRPGQRLVFLLRRLRHDFELRDALGTLPERRADAVGARVAAADDDDVLVLRRNLFRLGLLRLARYAAVLLRQEIHRVVEAVEVAPRRFGEEVERLFGADREQHGVVLAFEFFRRKILADVDAAMEGHALGFHLLDAPRDDGLFHLEIGNAIDEQAAGLARSSRRRGHRGRRAPAAGLRRGPPDLSR